MSNVQMGQCNGCWLRWRFWSGDQSAMFLDGLGRLRLVTLVFITEVR